MGYQKAVYELAEEIDMAFDKAAKAFSEFLLKTFNGVREQDKLLRELLGIMHNCKPDDFDSVDICKAYSYFMNITPSSRKIREPSACKGGEKV